MTEGKTLVQEKEKYKKVFNIPQKALQFFGCIESRSKFLNIF